MFYEEIPEFRRAQAKVWIQGRRGAKIERANRLKSVMHVISYDPLGD